MPDFALLGLQYWLPFFYGAHLIIPEGNGRKTRVITRLPMNDISGFRLSDACNGFLLLSCHTLDEKNNTRLLDYHVCNPLTYKTYQLPILHCNPLTYKTYQLPILHHSSHSPLFSMLAFDPRISLHYKVVVYFKCNKGTTAYVFSSERGREWRRLELGAVNNISNTRVTDQKTVCMNGYAYRLGTVHKNMSISDSKLETGCLVVLEFHVEEERLELIRIPPTDHVAPLLYHAHSFSMGARVGLGMAGGCLLYIAQVEREISIWRLEDQGQCRRWNRWRSISLHLLKHTPMLRPSYVPAWNGYEEALYFIAHGSLCRNSTKHRNQELICDWKQLAGSQRPHVLISFLCCAHDPAIKSVLR